jgi:hypothetical protein
MRADLDRALLGASLAFAGAAMLGSVVAIRDQLPGEPLGVSVPLSVPAGLLAGWGGGGRRTVADAGGSRYDSGGGPVPEASTRPGEVCAAIGLGCIVGTFIEPVTHRPRSWSAATRLTIGVNLAASAALAGAGAWHAATARGQHREG